MKSILFFICSCLITNVSFSQSIKKMNINELEAYINKSEKPLVVNFWATFCKPCVDELPYFQSIINKEYGGKVELLLVSLDLPDYYPAKITSFMAAKNFTAPCVWLNESNADIFCPRIDKNWDGTIPVSLFVNNKTKYRKFHDRALSPATLKKELAQLTR